MVYINNLNPIAFQIGPLTIRWYSLIYFFGFLTAYFLLNEIVNKKRIIMGFKLKKKFDIDNYLSGLIISSILFARLGHVIFYNLGFYLNNPLEIIKIWHGGLSFHFGFLGAILFSYFYSKKNNINFFLLADILVLPLSFFLFFGRIANFINKELIGYYTNLPWAVDFGDGPRHPVQIYEAIKNLLIFFLLLFFIKKRNKVLRKNSLNKEKRDFIKKDGLLFFLFIIFYSLGRFFTDFFRITEPGELLFIFSMSQWLSLIMLFLGLFFLVKFLKKK